MSRTNFRPFVRRISRHETVPPELREEAKALLKKPGRPVKKITAEILNEIQEWRDGHDRAAIRILADHHACSGGADSRECEVFVIQKS